MTGIGWEFYGIKFSMFLTLLAALVMYLWVWYGSNRSFTTYHTDTMAGEEGED